MIEARSMYRKKNGDGTYSYLLVLSTTRAGMTAIYLAPENAARYYEKIKEVYLEDFRKYLAFDRALYIGWSKIRYKDYEFIAKVPFRVISSVTTVIKHLYDGMIIQNEDGIFYYFDEHDASRKKEEIKEKTITSNVSLAVTETTSILEKAELYGIPVETPNTKAPSKMIDLLKKDNHSAHYPVSHPSNSSEKKGRNRASLTVARSLYTEEETLAIASMSINAICTKYDVSLDVANLMRRNAINFINGHTNTDKKREIKIEFTRLVKDGRTLEEISEICNITIGKARSLYKQYQISAGSREEDAADAVFESVKMSKEAMLDIIKNSSITDFAINHKCSRNKARTIFKDIVNILAKDILFVAGCDDLMLEQNPEEIILSIRESKSLKDNITVANYDAAMRLKSAYLDTWDQHADIESGMIQVPDSVAEGDKGRFLSLIHNRFSYLQTLSKNRVLTNTHKDVLKSGDVVAIAGEFMIDYWRATNLKRNFMKK